MSHERLLDASWRSKKKKDVHQTLIDHPVSIGLLLLLVFSHFLDEKTFILLQNFNFVFVLFVCLFVYFSLLSKGTKLLFPVYNLLTEKFDVRSS